MGSNSVLEGKADQYVLPLLSIKVFILQSTMKLQIYSQKSSKLNLKKLWGFKLRKYRFYNNGNILEYRFENFRVLKGQVTLIFDLRERCETLYMRIQVMKIEYLQQPGTALRISLKLLVL